MFILKSTMIHSGDTFFLLKLTNPNLASFIRIFGTENTIRIIVPQAFRYICKKMEVVIPIFSI